MGIYDSARTRIAPVFGRLQCLDPSGRLWVQGLLELGNTRKLPRPQAGTAGLRIAKWWPRQARLAAPRVRSFRFGVITDTIPEVSAGGPG